MRGIRSHLTYANIVATLAMVIAVGGGAAYAANTIRSSDIIDGQVRTLDISNSNGVRSVDVRDDTLADGGLTGADLQTNSVGNTEVQPNSIEASEIINESVNSAEIADDTLTGADIKDQSGIDTCTHSAQRLGELCVGSDHVSRTWYDTLNQCALYGLRLPTVGEALSLATNHNIPGFGESEFFWTDQALNSPGDGSIIVYVVSDDAGRTPVSASSTARTLCVTTPTN